jgi:hypothetical protein
MNEPLATSDFLKISLDTSCTQAQGSAGREIFFGILLCIAAAVMYMWGLPVALFVCGVGSIGSGILNFQRAWGLRRKAKTFL